MAVRARLTAPRPVREDWPWHEIKAASLKASLLFGGARRMEAESFLGSGFGSRLAIEAKASGWVRFETLGRTWQPGRLKGIQVGPEFGTPFLAATQVFDMRPVARKWLSLDRTGDHAERVLVPGTILVTCSGDVGRATLAHRTTVGLLVSHDLLRVEASEGWWGWLYAYVRSPTIRAMMKAAQYGHIIKHLETQHIDDLPVVVPTDAVRKTCQDEAELVLRARNEANSRMAEAEELFASRFHSPKNTAEQESGFVRRASQTLFSDRRRFDAGCYNPQQAEIELTLKQRAASWETLGEIGCEIWLPNRFKRVPAEDGVELINSSSIFEINPDTGRKVAPDGIEDRNKGFVKRDWLMMSRSGQVYGLLGSVALATERHEHKVVSDDVIRISTAGKIDPGYLYVALAHGSLGRPRVKSLAYGSSIPHIEPEDLKRFAVPRIDLDVEAQIGRLARRAFELWSQADQAEARLAEIADATIADFLLAAG